MIGRLWETKRANNNEPDGVAETSDRYATRSAGTGSSSHAHGFLSCGLARQSSCARHVRIMCGVLGCTCLKSVRSLNHQLSLYICVTRHLVEKARGDLCRPSAGAS